MKEETTPRDVPNVMRFFVLIGTNNRAVFTDFFHPWSELFRIGTIEGLYVIEGALRRKLTCDYLKFGNNGAVFRNNFLPILLFDGHVSWFVFN